MSDVKFPKLRGLAWEVKRTPRFGTIIQPSVVPGYEVRVPLAHDPLYNFQLSYKILTSGAVVNDTLNQLEGFFKARQGAYDSFLLPLSEIMGGDPSEGVVNDQQLPLDANYNSPLVRRQGGSGYLETIYELARLVNDDGTLTETIPAISLDGTILTPNSDYALYTPAETLAGDLNANGINYSGYVAHFTMSPQPVGIVTASFGWWYRVRFEQDMIDFDMFHYLLWQAQQVNLVGVRE